MKNLMLSFKLTALLLFLCCGKVMATQTLWVGQKYTCEISWVGSQVLLRNVSFTTTPSGLLTLTGSGFYRDVTPSSYFSGTAYVKVSYQYSFGAGLSYTSTTQTWAIKCQSNPLKIYSSTMAIKVNGSDYIAPSLTYTNAYSSSVRYSFSGYDTSIISISSDGKVTGKKAGTTTVTVSSTHSANQCTCKVTVTAAHTHSLTSHAATAATCTTSGNSAYWYCSGCGKYFTNSSATTETTLSAVTVAALGHNYGSAVFTWSSDGKSATAKRTCSRNSSHTLSGTASVTSAVKTVATCSATGITTYTAKISLGGTTYAATKDIQDIAALGHNYETSDNGDGTHTRSCSRCNSEVTESHTYVNGVCSVCGNDITTAISTVDASWQIEPSAYYNLAGQRVSNATGIVIVNRKKILKVQK